MAKTFPVEKQAFPSMSILPVDPRAPERPGQRLPFRCEGVKTRHRAVCPPAGQEPSTWKSPSLLAAAFAGTPPLGGRSQLHREAGDCLGRRQ